MNQEQQIEKLVNQGLELEELKLRVAVCEHALRLVCEITQHLAGGLETQGDINRLIREAVCS